MKLRFRLDDKKPLVMAKGINGLPIGLEKAMINIVELEPDSVIPVHSHPEEQISLIISGELEFEMGDDKFRLGPGEVLLIPANLKHGAKSLKKTLAYDCFSPPRWDYLEKIRK